MFIFAKLMEESQRTPNLKEQLHMAQDQLSFAQQDVVVAAATRRPAYHRITEICSFWGVVVSALVLVIVFVFWGNLVLVLVLVLVLIYVFVFVFVFVLVFFGRF
jgi:hypothetical protein